MPREKPPNEQEISPARHARNEAQLMLGQIHGLVSAAALEARDWLRQDPAASVSQVGMTNEDIGQAAEEIHANFGEVHAALNTGACDEQLLKVGMAGSQGRLKKKGLLAAIDKYFRAKKSAVSDRLVSIQDGLRWSATIIGSLGSAISKELERFPGAAAAAEGIREFLEVLDHAADAAEKKSPPTSPVSTYTQSTAQTQVDPKG